MKRTTTRILAPVLAVAVLAANVDAPAQEGPAATVAESQAPVADGEALFRAKTCFTCHGPDAKTPILPNYPRLAGQNREYVLQQMRDIKTGARSNGQTAAMKGIMFLVNDEEMQVLAKYISSLEP